ncbi:MAG: type III pantothenate kinase [Steroidobacteraceae bacterium]
MKLLVDIGNTRVKWATLDDRGPAAQRAAAHAGWCADDWLREVLGEAEVTSVLVASTNAAASTALEAATRQRLGRPPQFVVTTGAAAGVRNAYRDPGLLGVDRWLAVIAAHAITRATACVADFGTATTFDAVTAQGEHLGGYIVPGPTLMVASLHAGTSDLAARAAASGAAGGAALADNTREAIERGCRLAAAAFVERAVDDVARRLGTRPRLLVTGGAAAEILPLLRVPAEPVPDLVIRGLAEWSRSTA